MSERSVEPQALIETADEALRRAEWSAAEDGYRSALEHRDSGEALFGLAIARWWQGDTVEALRSWEQAYVAFCKVPDPAQAAFTGIYLCLSYRMSMGNDAAANGWLERAASLVEDHGLDPLRGWVLLCRAYVASDSADPLAAEQFAGQALALARAEGDADLMLCATSERGAALVEMGKLEQGAALLDQAMAAALAGEVGDLDSVVLISCRTITSCTRAADIKRAVQWVRAADDFNERHGSTHLYTTCRTHYGAVLFATGDWVKAEEELRAALEVGARAEAVLRAEAAAKLAELRVAQGRIDDAERLLAKCDEHGVAAHARALVHLAKGEPAVAVSLLLRRLADLSDVCIERAPLVDTLIEAVLASGSEDRHAAARGEAVARYGATTCAFEAAYVARARGRSSAAAGGDSAAGDLQHSASSFASLEMPFECARSRLLLAQTLATDRRHAALADAQDALATFDRLGAVPGADAAARLLRSLGIRAPRTGPKGQGLLTKREREVLRLLGEGLSNPAIAERLYISRKTVEHHVASVLSKLGLSGRAEAAVYAARNPEGDSASQ